MLEQRIGRVHRLGQTKSVQVVNFVAQGTIEEGMLSVLAFKKSLFAGVLDGGETEVFLHGTRLSRFMESVDQVTGAMGEADVGADMATTADVEAAAASPRVDVAHSEDAAASRESPSEVKAGEGAPTTNPWTPLIDAGLKFVEVLNAAGNSGTADASSSAATWIETDPHTGKSYIRLPVPEPGAVQRLADALGSLLAGLRKP